MSDRFVLIADDVEMNREILSMIIEDKYNIVTASNGLEALDIIEKNPDDVIALLLDLMMPELDGYGVLERLKELSYINRFPVLVITAESDVETEKRCFKYGIFDFIRKPFHNHIVETRVENAIQLYELKNSLEDKVDEQTKQIKEQNENLLHINENIIELLGSLVEFRNNESGTHVKRVKTYTYIIASYLSSHFPKYGLSQDDVNGISVTSPLHDLGKIKISDAVLLKPGKFTDEEREEMKKHTIYGSSVLETFEGIWDKNYYEFAVNTSKYHHERYDGKGYPEGLSGDDIPICAQIVALADCYDALVNKRSYKEPFTPEKATEMIMNGECGAFNPDIISCLDGCKDIMREIALNGTEVKL